MITAHTIRELRMQLDTWRKQGQKTALVPTMGNLHRGHIELVRTARKHADRVVASIFVNPLQFGPKEDFGRYPRTLPADQIKLADAGCDLLFAPNAQEIYPQGMENLARVSVPDISTILCGHFRPGHFDGVATVVNILFNLVQPDIALFGEKDYQQLLVIRRMVADLHLPLDVLGVATQREPDGLALSSRNQYLSTGERAQSSRLFAALGKLADGLRAGRRDFAILQAEAIQQLEQAGFRSQYLEIRARNLSQADDKTSEFVILAAAFLGATRLIDNLVVST